MERIRIKQLKDFVGKEVVISGWVDVRRDHGKLIFFDLRDRSGEVQVVVQPQHKEALNAAEELRGEWVVKIKGEVNKRPEKMINTEIENGDIEIEAKIITILGKAHELPFDRDEKLNLDTYLDHLPLVLRTKRGRAIFKVQASIVEAFREALRSQDFVEFQAPGLVGGDAEGGSNVFKVEYFNEQTAYLATSPQLYKQIMVGVFERVFMTGKVFRAEPHSTTRHINEYTTMDFEVGFITDYQDIMATLESVVRGIISVVEQKHSVELALFDGVIPKIPKQIPQIKLRKGQQIIKENYGEDCTNEPDLAPQHEEWLSKYAREKFDSDFLYVTHFPVEKRPFYTYEDEEDPGYTKSFDLLFRGIEITTGGQRIHNYDTLVSNIKKWDLNPKTFAFYLEAFQFGMPPHGGSATGLERLTAKLLGLKNIKEATLFPREMNRIDTLLSE